ncbi:MAG: 8-amino-7-oxononanoate synthase [Thiobacillaceae bacterium]|nr:8-amino-7-oxononanoate synthase [Thiobacillaceae bacterium]
MAARGRLRRRWARDGGQGAHIWLEGREYLSFASNDYLGLANHSELVAEVQIAAGRHGVGAGAAHLLSGHHALHQALEAELAAFVGLPAALLFTCGYMANLGVVTALLGHHDAIFADRLNHASLTDAAILSRAQHHRYPHLDLAALERMLADSRARVKMIATDAVFSMDGDLAPLPELLALAERYGAWLYVDDAHGFGVLGAEGRGSLEHHRLTLHPSPLPPHPALIYMATLGKAAGVSGAFVAGSPELIDWLTQRARTHIYTTASPPMLAAAVRRSLRLIRAGEQRRAQLRGLIERLRRGAEGLPWRLRPSDTPIQPLIVGEDAAAVQLSEALRTRGLWVPAIRPPTVPEGTARLRISLSAAHREADIDRLLEALHAIATECR